MSNLTYQQNYNRMQRASKKLNIPVADLNPAIVNLLFGSTNYNVVYTNLCRMETLAIAAKRSGLRFDDVLQMVERNL